MNKVRIEPDSDDATEFERYIETAKRIGRPKAVYMESFVQSRGEETVTLEDRVFTSRMLRIKLDGVERVFPYVVTCGHEMDDVDLSSGDFVAQFWWDTIKEELLWSANDYFLKHIKKKYLLRKTMSMNPGSGDVDVWPIEQQGELFNILGDIKACIGVKLTDSFLMLPNKTVSGILFQAETDFATCQVCRREVCPSRSAPFDKALWALIQRDQ
ncbi:MAG: vitamin B12 dependent methionine synthase [Lentisphaerae bacterium]|nr:vitamin B12 dependent methionine synthase [Lentisphaerota bacterium]